jgi:hypothetical protein
VEGGHIVTTKRAGTYAGYRLKVLTIDVTIWKDSSFVNAHDMLIQLREAHRQFGGRRSEETVQMGSIQEMVVTA